MLLTRLVMCQKAVMQCAIDLLVMCHVTLNNVLLTELVMCPVAVSQCAID